MLIWCEISKVTFVPQVLPSLIYFVVMFSFLFFFWFLVGLSSLQSYRPMLLPLSKKEWHYYFWSQSKVYYYYFLCIQIRLQHLHWLHVNKLIQERNDLRVSEEHNSQLGKKYMLYICLTRFNNETATLGQLSLSFKSTNCKIESYILFKCCKL